jgi:hypothetical protein
MSDGEVVGFDELARYTSNELVTTLEVEHWRARIGDRDFPHRVESARRQGYRPDELVRIIDEVS